MAEALFEAIEMVRGKRGFTVGGDGLYYSLMGYNLSILTYDGNLSLASGVKGKPNLSQWEAIKNAIQAHMNAPYYTIPEYVIRGRGVTYMAAPGVLIVKRFMEMDVVYDGQEFDGPAGKIRYSFETFKEINWNDAVERTRMQNMQLVLDTVGNHPDFYVTKSSIVLHVDGRPTNGGMIVVSVKKQGHAKIFDVFSGRNSVVSLGDAIDYIRKLKMACTPYLTESRRAILRRGISVYYAYADMLWSRGQIIASGTVYEINGERDMYSFDGFISKYNLQTE